MKGWCAHCEEPVTGNYVHLYASQYAHKPCHEKYAEQKNAN